MIFKCILKKKKGNLAKWHENNGGGNRKTEYVTLFLPWSLLLHAANKERERVKAKS
jgi:hypothetical protein